MKDLLKESLAPLYLGGALTDFGNINWYQWQFYAIVIPFFIIVKLTNFNQNKK